MSFDNLHLSTLKNVKAIDQTKFEEDIISKADKAYQDHVTEEKESLIRELKQTSARLKVISDSVDQLNECLLNHIRSGRSSYDDFQKIKNSLQNQINSKKSEQEKLKRIESRLIDQLKSVELSDKFTNILDEAGRHKNDSDVLLSQRGSEVKVRSECAPSTVKSDDEESDDSGDSEKTMVFEADKEEPTYEEPLIKKRKMDKEAPYVGMVKTPRLKNDRMTDDADNEDFYERIIEYQNGIMAKEQEQAADDLSPEEEVTDDEDIGNGFIVPGKVWHRLYQFQQTGVRWLLQLHTNNVGGILGDEMGLGKTIQVIAFLAGLQKSRGVHYECGPVLIVCPATVLRQWLIEFRAWAPMFRVAVLHSTGNGYDRPKRLIATIAMEPGVLLTTYTSMVLHHSLLVAHNWHYVILDEGHKIKNPNTKMTTCVKKFHTPHRLIMSGSPIQNNLKELWSLVDFVYPGKLGSLASFMQNFAVPIMKGGYEHASPMQVEAAYRCACVIRDTINAYLIRRSKTEVELQLPKKSEQVLFCGLTEHQTLVYKEYLRSKQCRQILAGKEVPFPGLVTLRKLCNHTDLVTGGPNYVMDHPVLGFGREEGVEGHSHKYGHYTRSGKMLVMRELLDLWYRGKHKVLLFTQGRMMLQILRRFVEDRHYPYCVMDGTTAIGNRHNIVQRFNSAPYDEAFVFLLTTRVGGIGLNLTGADRVLVFDPDWNPCTDLQARERSWRIGQSRQVTIYRLVTTGTIEEKIYHRQVFKQFLTNRILKNPRQRRFFKTQDLHDLFRFDDKTVASDTSLMFAGDKNYKQLKSNYFDDHGKMTHVVVDDSDEEDKEVVLPRDLSELDKQEMASGESTAAVCEEEVARLREQAKRLSQAIGRWQESTTASTRVEGQDIANVRYRREYRSREDDVPVADTSNIAGEHIVSVLVPRKLGHTDSALLSYQESRAADKVAEKAKRSLDQTLAAAGVTDRLRHDAVLADPASDWALQQTQAESAAKAAIVWLRARVMLGDGVASGGDGATPVLGSVRDCVLYNADEERVYLQSLDDSAQTTHFTGSSTLLATNHVRFSSTIMLAIISRRRSAGTTAGHSADLISTEVKSIAKSLYLFLREPHRHGTVPSNQIISYFKHRVPPARNLLFKSLLTALCSFHKDPDGGHAMWRLRPDFCK